MSNERCVLEIKKRACPEWGFPRSRLRYNEFLYQAAKAGACAGGSSRRREARREGASYKRCPPFEVFPYFDTKPGKWRMSGAFWKSKNTPAPKGAFPGAGSGTADFYTRLQKREPAPGKVLGGGRLGGRAASYKRCPPFEVFSSINLSSCLRDGFLSGNHKGAALGCFFHAE